MKTRKKKKAKWKYCHEDETLGKIYYKDYGSYHNVIHVTEKYFRLYKNIKNGNIGSILYKQRK